MPEQVRRTRGLTDERATQALAREIALFAKPGDLIALAGDLGSGKTSFARAFIRALAADDRLEVPSPTFTLVQNYGKARIPMTHCDLYRLGDAAETAELGLEDALEEGIVLVEWPERGGGALPGENRLDIALELAGGGRMATLSATRGDWPQRLERMETISGFLAANGLADAQRTHLQGDASTRRYERLRTHQGPRVLMDAPARPDPGLDGAPSYSRIAHLAESVHPFVAMADGLRAVGVHAPQIVARDLDAGLLVLEDLGTGKIISDDDPPTPIAERYIASARLLAHLHGRDLPDSLPVDAAANHHLPPFDLGVFEAEASLLLDWYVPHVLGSACAEDARTGFTQAWRAVLAETGTLERDTTWVLRDHHSPNIVWCSDGDMQRAAVIDFQDALLGPAAYDVASLAMDARVDVPEALERRIVAGYLALRRQGDTFDEDAFLIDYAVMGAQRNTKILGIFARLNARDGKPGYLRHIPRVAGYLARCLKHSALGPVADWYARHLPPATDEVAV